MRPGQAAPGGPLEGRRRELDHHGAGTGCNLVLQGMWLQGADIVLAGKFETVSLRLVTLDPGTLAQTTGGGTPPLGTTIDGMTLAPVHLCVEASIQTPDAGALHHRTDRPPATAA